MPSPDVLIRPSYIEGAESVFGGRIRYKKIGDGKPIFAIHGLNGSSGDFESVATQLASDHTVVIPDLAGYGISEPFKTKSHTMRAHVEAIEIIADRLGIERFAIMGDSMGSVIAALLASRGSRISDLFLENVPYVPSHLSKLARKPAAQAVGTPLARYLLHNPWVERAFNPAISSYTKEQLKDRYRRLRKASPRAVAESVIDLLRYDMKALLQETSVPVLNLQDEILVGTKLKNNGFKHRLERAVIGINHQNSFQRPATASRIRSVTYPEAA